MNKANRPLLLGVVASLLLSLSTLFAFTADAQPAESPLPPSFDRMGSPPSGANDWSCIPSAAHPRPVVLVHGTDMDMSSTWSTLSPKLAEQGYCVFALDYGMQSAFWDPSIVAWGVGDIAESAEELSTFVDTVIASTGAPQVDIIGHSQGGVVARQYLKFNGGADAANPDLNKVDNLITLGATNHGTSFNGLQQLFLAAKSLGLPKMISEKLLFGTAGSQQLIGSPFLSRLNADSEALPDVKYTVIATKFDEIVTPPERTFLNPASGSVDNLWVQDECPTSKATHLGLTSDPTVASMVYSALDPQYTASETPACS